MLLLLSSFEEEAKACWVIYLNSQMRPSLLSGIGDCFQLSSISVFEDPFVSCRQFLWKRGNTSRCRWYHSSLTLRSFSFHTFARDICQTLCWKGAVYPILYLFFGVRSTLKIFHRLRVRERRPRLSLFLRMEFNMPIALVCNLGYFNVSRRSWWTHLS